MERARESKVCLSSKPVVFFDLEGKAETTMTEKKNEDYLAIAPPKRTTWESLKLFLWNGETNEFLGRTAGSWGKSNLSYFS